MANFLRHEGCPKCGSSDALAIYDDGSTYCFNSVCDYRTRGDGSVSTETLPKAKPLNMAGVVASIPNRRISQETCSKYGVTVEYSGTGEIIKHFYPYYSTDTNEICAAKVREVKTKSFYSTGDSKSAGFFGNPGAIIGLISSIIGLVFIFTR